VGKSKTMAGTGRVIPLNPRAVAALTHWRGLFPGAQPWALRFPHEKYGLAGNDRKQCAHGIVPTEPMQRWKVAWEGARKAAKVSCRFHDRLKARVIIYAYNQRVWLFPPEPWSLNNHRVYSGRGSQHCYEINWSTRTSNVRKRGSRSLELCSELHRCYVQLSTEGRWT